MRNIHLATLTAATLLAGCTPIERNSLARGLCDRERWCTATDNRPAQGPPHARGMEQRRQASATVEPK